MADPSVMNGAWTVVAPLCLDGTLSGASWSCHGAWTGSIKPRPDPYYPGHLLLDVWPEPAHWQNATVARVTYVSATEVHAVLIDGYTGFFGSVLYFCR